MSMFLETISGIAFFILLACLIGLVFFMARFHVVWAIAWRNVKSFFTSELGYVFIVSFVACCALLTFRRQFFAENQANLDQLTTFFPLVLLFFVPSITMNIWAGEKNQGTDAILFTLPATDLEILLGKYVAVACTYSIALLFSMTQLIALACISTPDWGVIFATYLGYWMAGLSLLAIGMFASSLTRSATVAFVLGAIFCAVPVLAFQFLSSSVWVQQLSTASQLRDFANGLIPLNGIFYFVATMVFMLYLNYVVITQRHWSAGQQFAMGGHFAVRIVSLLAVLLAMFFGYQRLSSHLKTQYDLTGQRLYSLSSTTRDTVDTAVESERSVTIQAFVSRDMPRQYVDAKRHFINLLRQYSRMSNSIHVEIIEIESESDEARDAKTLGIEPRNVTTKDGGVTVEQAIYLGAYISGPTGDVLLPFIHSDAFEYELTRAMAVVTDQQEKPVVGILRTDTHFGGWKLKRPGEDQAMVLRSDFATVNDEIAKNYNVVTVTVADLSEMVVRQSPGYKAPKRDEALSDVEQFRENLLNKGPDVLIVAGPSSLSQLGLSQLVAYLEMGKPVLILDDPLPFYPWLYEYHYLPILGIVGAPRQSRIAHDPRSQTPPPDLRILSADFDLANQFKPIPPKARNGTAADLLLALGIQWDNGATVWNTDDSALDFEPIWPQQNQEEEWPAAYGPKDKLIVDAKRSGDFDGFAVDSPITSGLSEVVFFYPGTIEKAKDAKTKFTPLISLSEESGRYEWDQLTEQIIREQPVMVGNRPAFDANGNIRTAKQPAKSPFTGLPIRRVRQELRNVSEKTTGRAIAQVSVENSANTKFMIAQSSEVKAGQKMRLVRGDKEPLEYTISKINNSKKSYSPGDTIELEFAKEVEFKTGDVLEFFELESNIVGQRQHIAARITGKNARKKQINAIFIADCDFISELFLIQESQFVRRPDNILFFENCLDQLAKKDDFVELRSRRPRPRTLTVVERQKSVYRKKRYDAQKLAELDIERRLRNAKQRFGQSSESTDERTDLSETQKDQLKFTSLKTESRIFELDQKRLKKELNEKVEELKSKEQAQVKSMEERIRWLSVILTPLPAIVLGIVVLVIRRQNERKSVSPNRRA